ncbi:MAG: ribbon-helix-helix domain-containing protein [Kiloniellaceae bacterium]
MSTLVNKNVFIGRRRTSVRLEPAMWDALAEICRREGMTLHEVCGLVDARRQASSLTAAIRVFILTYFRSAATEAGHANNGHGTLYRTRRRMRNDLPRLRAGRAGAPGGVYTKSR